MPPAVSVPLGAMVFGVLYLIFGERYAPGLAVGFFAGYLVYDMIHYYLHHFAPQGRLGRMLRERHMRHHFQDDTRGFGISAPYWDEIFRTSRALRARRGADRSRTRRVEQRGTATSGSSARGKSRPQPGLDSGFNLKATTRVPPPGHATLQRQRKGNSERTWPPPTSTGS